MYSSDCPRWRLLRQDTKRTMTLVAQTGETVNRVIHSFMESGKERATVGKNLGYSLQGVMWETLKPDRRRFYRPIRPKLRYLAIRLNGKFGVSQTLDMIKNTCERCRVK